MDIFEAVYDALLSYEEAEDVGDQVGMFRSAMLLREAAAALVIECAKKLDPMMHVNQYDA